MATKDADRARSRFIAAVTRYIAGARLQRERLALAAAAAPRLLEGSAHEFIDLTATPDSDLDYYVYELGRLQDAAREILKVFDSPSELEAALAQFNQAVPNLRRARNPLTHASDDSRLDHVSWLRALVRHGPDASAEYLVDPRGDHHSAAEMLASALLLYLRAGLRGDPG